MPKVLSAFTPRHTAPLRASNDIESNDIESNDIESNDVESNDGF